MRSCALTANQRVENLIVATKHANVADADFNKLA
jgi:hypothetical protein